MLGFSNLISILASGTGASAVDPLYNAISLIGPYALGVVIALGAIYGVIVGYRFAKAKDTEERAKMQKILVNGCIGFFAIIVLIGILYAIRGPLSRWMNS